ncbi:unnamed protein product [Heligmosomoides polygyrus]|uniref:Neur_chan_LBD domain-containing protein n=1 Tax=Heligmosomoides polygyrus TaxID=6339 RepID=A0A183F5D3_HELPZ|nr:unnamed protein product [Heligmosomoides polygyrus]
MAAEVDVWMMTTEVDAQRRVRWSVESRCRILCIFELQLRFDEFCFNEQPFFVQPLQCGDGVIEKFLEIPVFAVVFLKYFFVFWVGSDE